MIVKKNIQFSFIAILVLFALNFSFYFWGTQQKLSATESLQQATSRKSLTTTVKQNVMAVQEQIDRLGQLQLDSSIPTPLPATEIKRLNARSAMIGAQIASLKQLTNIETRAQVEALQTSYIELAASWRFFNENFGVNHIQALTQLALHAAPTSQRILNETIPQLEILDNQQIDSAHQQLRVASIWASETAFFAFIMSLYAAVAFAAQAYGRLAKGLDALRQGALSLHNGNSPQRISLQTKDEFGEVASSFNTLSEALQDSLARQTHLEQTLVQRENEIRDQRKIAESLLLNTLPAKVAEEFRQKGSVAPKYLEDVTIVFTDFVGFSSSAETLAAEDLVQMLDDYFSTFDEIATRYGLEKLKTIGDSYMCAGGLPERNPSHPVDAVMAAMEIVRAVTERSATNRNSLAVRVGIHTGHVIAGIVGKQKFSYDIWGESVNYASRVESSSEPNQIAMSGQTYLRVKDFFECDKQIRTNAKVAQNMELYFLKGFLPSLIDDSKQIPPIPFARRYQGYFQKEPPAFPLYSIPLNGKPS